MTTKKGLSERDICTNYINPAFKKAGWYMQLQVREEVSFTAGRIIERGKVAHYGHTSPGRLCAELQKELADCHH